MTNTMQKRQNEVPDYSFGNVVDNIFNNTMRRFFDGNFWDSDTHVNTGRVPVNVRENGQQYEVDVIAPGCRKEDFNIQLQDNVLTISFNHKEEKKEQDNAKGWERNEYIKRSFSRSFTLDDTVDANRIEASYKDGILHLTLAKNEKARKASRVIEVK